MNEPEPTPVSPARKKQQTGILLVVVVLAYMGQMILNPVLAPLARTLGMEEWHVGAIISMSALVVTLLSRFWGTYSQKVGAKRVLMISMLGGFASLGAFALVAHFADRGLIAGFWLVFGAIATRGVLYGGSILGVMPAAQSYVVLQSESEQERVKSVGALGAMNGLSGILGSLAGGALSMIGGLMLPLAVMPLMMLVAFAVVALAFKPVRGAGTAENPRKVRYFDHRVLPFLLVGFALFLLFSSLQTVFGFMVQDRLALDPAQTAGHTAALMIVMSVVMIAFQAAIAPKLGLPARRMILVGFALLVASAAIFLFAGDLPSIVAATVAMGAGTGFAMPGYNAAPTMEVDADEQGGLAGLIMANNSLTYIIAPILSTFLYGLDPLSPFVLNLALAAAGLILCIAHPRLRSGSRQ
ncbi:MFS transporter [Curtanaerobium respiraculi]|uniref:MFS transporter n=1 Tax=Curtanaerobium respiraculi TaxID=2949669 RepID=UPI0024B38A40|nr:MFS transporter [Curtanaerobium respiraculi]